MGSSAPLAGGPARKPVLLRQAAETREAARELRARMHHLLDHRRHLLLQTAETVQHLRASRDHWVEQRALRTLRAPAHAAQTDSLSPLRVLLVEDNPGDVRLFRDVLTECRRAVQLSVLSSGADVLPFLRQEGRYAQVPCPTLIFLDLGLPGAPGASVLAEIRADPALADIAVVIFSGMPAAHESAPALVGAQGWIDKNMPLWELWYTLTTVLEHL